jgi:hypothetical protein
MWSVIFVSGSKPAPFPERRKGMRHPESVQDALTLRTWGPACWTPTDDAWWGDKTRGLKRDSSRDEKRDRRGRV